MRDITLGDTFTFCFTTRSFSTGVPTSLLGTPVLSVKEGANDTIITAGVSVDVDTGATPVTGLNEGTVVATSGNGYEAGKSYAVYISTGTVGGVSVVGEVVEQFTIQLSAAAVDLANGTDGLGALAARLPAALTANGNMKCSLMEILTTALTETAGLLAGGFKKFFNVATPTGTLNSMPDAVPGAAGGVFIAGTNAATTVTTGLTATFTGNLTGSAGSVVGAVGSVGAGGITAASIATGAIDADAIAADAVTEIQAGLSTLDAAGIRTAVGLASASLDTQLGALPTATENADALLKRDWTAVTGEAARSALNALRFLRNKWSISAGTLTVTTEDDSTSAWTGAVTTAASNPVDSIDPS